MAENASTDDLHFCIICKQTIEGLFNYVDHRKNACMGDNQKTEPEDLSLQNAGHCKETSLKATDDGKGLPQTVPEPEYNRNTDVHVALNTDLRKPDKVDEVDVNEPQNMDAEGDGTHEIGNDISLVITASGDKILKFEELSEITDKQWSAIPDDVKSVLLDTAQTELGTDTNLIPVAVKVENSHINEDYDDLDYDDNSEGLDDMKTEMHNENSMVKSESQQHFGLLSATLDEGITEATLTPSKRRKRKRKHGNLVNKSEIPDTDTETKMKRKTDSKDPYSPTSPDSRSSKGQHERSSRKRKRTKKDYGPDIIVESAHARTSVDRKKCRKGKETSEIHVCALCDKKFTSITDMINHLITQEHKLQEYFCKSKPYFFQHKYQGAIVQLSPFRCDICSFYFNRNEDLEAHVKSRGHREMVEKADEEIECTLCEYQTKSHEDIVEHLGAMSHVKRSEWHDKACVIRYTKTLKSESISDLNDPKIKSKEKAEAELENVVDETESILGNKKSDGSMKDETNSLDSNISKSDDQNNAKTEREVDTEHESKEILNDGLALNDDEDSDTVYEMWNGRMYKKHIKRFIECKCCPYKSKRSGAMRAHYMEKHPSFIRFCEVCDMVFYQDKGYRLHILSKMHQDNVQSKTAGSAEAKYECHVCKKKFEEENFCKFHTAFYHFHFSSEKALAKEGLPSITRDKYREFFKVVEKTRTKELLNCPECNAVCLQANILGHLRKHTGEQPFKCNICDEKFYCTSTLRRHLLKHFGCTERTCQVCGKHFNSVTPYEHHMKIHKAQNTSEEKMHICHICGASFYAAHQLRGHMKNHDENVLKCDYPGCHWTFKHNCSLNRHRATHDKTNSVVCPTCGYITTSMKYLKAHIKTHSKERILWQCEYCPYKATQRTHLRRHLRIHTGSKPFKCPYCEYSCNTHNNLRKHILETSMHKGLHVYPCKFCDYSTNCTKEFRAHLVAKHNEETNGGARTESLAAFAGLFRREEDLLVPKDGADVIPCTNRKTSRRINHSETDTRPIVKRIIESEIDSKPVTGGYLPDSNPVIQIVFEESQ